jgi:beta-glucosidase
VLVAVAGCDGGSGASSRAADAARPDAAPADAAPADAAVDHFGLTFPAPGPIAGAAGRGGFRFGVSTAATQIEDQNPQDDWYWWTLPAAQGGAGHGKAPLGEAVRGYTLALDDVARLRELHVDAYRFGIEWARVEPRRGQFDEAALAHYDALIDALRAAGIRPMITIHHFANPIWVDDFRAGDCPDGPSDANLCGLGHPQGGAQVVAAMAEFAATLARRYGDRVDEWATLNEPVNYLVAAYGAAIFPPGRTDLISDFPRFMATTRDYVAAHAAMYDAIKANDTVDADGDGVAAAVGYTASVAEWVPARNHMPSDDPADVAAADRVRYVYHSLFTEAIRQGRFDTDLDGTFDEDHPEWRGKLDWLGVQYYFRAGVTGQPALIPAVHATPCFSAIDLGACLPAAEPTHWIPVMRYEYYEPGLYDVLTDFAQRWPDLPLVVTEAGIATDVGRRRAEHVVRTLEQIERARAAGADVRGYYHWSLMDNFEWAEGYAPHFGLYAVDRTTFARTPTEGATVFGRVAETRRLDAQTRATYGGLGPMTPEPAP